jgi:hypothetical protein
METLRPPVPIGIQPYGINSGRKSPKELYIKLRISGNTVTSEPVATTSKNSAKNHDVIALASPAPSPTTNAKIAFGKALPAQQQLLLYNSTDWEAFTQEWVTAVGKDYIKIGRFSGAGDMGVDVAGFRDQNKFKGNWDNYQCKYYADPISTNVACEEIGKLIWYCFKGEFDPPQRYYFVAPKAVAPSLKKLLSNGKLKAEVKARWDKVCRTKITTTQVILLEDTFLAYFDKFDFRCFDYKDGLELVDDHRKSPYFAARFGGGLPDRPVVNKPPPHTGPSESRYIEQLYAVYSERKSETVKDAAKLGSYPELSEHLDRQRESFYHAEALRNFARDTVPSGTFESLQQEIYDGVVEVEQSDHKDGLDRVNAVTQCAANLQITSNGLITVMNVKDRKGICHQLANVDRLTWKKS